MFELSKLFGSQERVKIIRFFLSHRDDPFSFDEIYEKVRIKEDVLKKELVALEKSTLVIKTTFRNSRQIAYILDNNFRYLETLTSLMFDFKSANRDALKDRFAEIGRAKLLMLSGVFTGDDKARCDILYVGEGIRVHSRDKLLAELEAEIGFPLRITILDLEEFNYRYKMFDRFIRDAVSVDDSEVLIKKIVI